MPSSSESDSDEEELTYEQKKLRKALIWARKAVARKARQKREQEEADRQWQKEAATTGTKWTLFHNSDKRKGKVEVKRPSTEDANASDEATATKKLKKEEGQVSDSGEASEAAAEAEGGVEAVSSSVIAAPASLSQGQLRGGGEPGEDADDEGEGEAAAHGKLGSSSGSGKKKKKKQEQAEPEEEPSGSPAERALLLARLTAFYAQHNPEKTPEEVAAGARKFAGEAGEAELNLGLRGAYNDDLDSFPASDFPGEFAALEEEREAARRAALDEKIDAAFRDGDGPLTFRGKLLAFYAKHDAEKLEQLDALVEKYGAKADIFMEAVCMKYSVDTDQARLETAQFYAERERKRREKQQKEAEERRQQELAKERERNPFSDYVSAGRRGTGNYGYNQRPRQGQPFGGRGPVPPHMMRGPGQPGHFQPQMGMGLPYQQQPHFPPPMPMHGQFAPPPNMMPPGYGMPPPPGGGGYHPQQQWQQQQHRQH